MEDVSHQMIHGTTKRQPREFFEQEEKRKLQSLPGEDYETSLLLRRKVGSNCHLEDLTRLTNNEKLDEWPCFSQDGSMIVCSHGVEGDKDQFDNNDCAPSIDPSSK